MKAIKREKVWKHLKRHGSITTREAWREYGLYRLSGTIFVWRKRGIQIDSIEESDGLDTWTRYRLDRKEADRAEKEGLIRYEAV